MVVKVFSETESSLSQSYPNLIELSPQCIVLMTTHSCNILADNPWQPSDKIESNRYQIETLLNLCSKIGFLIIELTYFRSTRTTTAGPAHNFAHGGRESGANAHNFYNEII